VQVRQLVDTLLDHVMTDSPAMADVYGRDLSEFSFNLQYVLTAAMDQVCPEIPTSYLIANFISAEQT
jgi:hypothetical protein